MKKLLAVILLFCSVKGFSQKTYIRDADDFLSEHFVQDPFFNTNMDGLSSITLYSNAYLISNSLNQSFYQDVVNDGYIDNTTKNNISNNLSPFNTADFNYNASIAYRHHLDSILGCKTGNLFISLGTRSLNSARFTNDAFNLVFFGNAQYAGQTAYLSGSNASLVYFNQLRIGWSGTKSGNGDKSISFGGAISFLQGRRNFSLNVPAATLYTQEDGEYINAAYNFTYKTNDTTSSNLASFNGVGASLDAFVKKQFSRTFSVSFLVSDLGFIDWGKNSLQTTADSGIHFTGYNAGDLFDLTDTAFNKINKDSILRLLGVHEHKQSFITSLPFHLELSCSKYFTSCHSVLSAGLVYWNYNPGQFILYARFNHSFGSHFFAGITADVNSIGSYEAGLDAGVYLKRFSISASVGNAFENFIPQTSSSVSANISIAYSF